MQIFLTVFETVHLCISWWIEKKTLIMSRCCTAHMWKLCEKMKYNLYYLQSQKWVRTLSEKFSFSHWSELWRGIFSQMIPEDGGRRLFRNLHPLYQNMRSEIV
jgi:hypothetical protein